LGQQASKHLLKDLRETHWILFNQIEVLKGSSAAMRNARSRLAVVSLALIASACATGTQEESSDVSPVTAEANEVQCPGSARWNGHGCVTDPTLQDRDFAWAAQRKVYPTRSRQVFDEGLAFLKGGMVDQARENARRLIEYEPRFSVTDQFTK
jgi:hypothetical protein